MKRILRLIGISLAGLWCFAPPLSYAAVEQGENFRRPGARPGAYIEVEHVPPYWSYRVRNVVRPGSSYHISSVQLVLPGGGAVFSISASPAGWKPETDNQTQVSWTSKDEESPFPHDIHPGKSLGDFKIQSKSKPGKVQFVISGWDTQKGEMVTMGQGTVAGPAADGTHGYE